MQKSLYEIQYIRHSEACDDEADLKIKKCVVSFQQLKAIKLIPWITILSQRQTCNKKTIRILY